MQDSSFQSYDVNMVQVEMRENISRLIDKLGVINAGMESHFVGLGEHLEKISLSASEMVNTSIAIDNTVTEQLGDKFARDIRDSANGNIEQLHKQSEVITNNVGYLQEISHEMKGMKSASDALTRLGKRLRAVNLSIHVESARTQEATVMFDAFIQQLNSLVNEILTIARNVLNDSSQACVTQDVSKQETLQAQGDLVMLAERGRSAVDSAIEQVRILAINASESGIRVLELGKSVTNCVGELVMALQYRDITRQQLEHVSQALVNIEFALKSEEECEQVFSTSYPILMVQNAQVEQVCGFIEKVRKDLDNGFANIAQIANQIAIISKSATKSESESGNDGFQSLAGALETVESISATSAEILDKASETAGNALHVVDILTSHAEHVSDISAEMNLQALNAVISSSRLGNSGKTLAVLAQQVTALSRESEIVVRIILDILQKVRSKAERARMSDVLTNHVNADLSVSLTVNAVETVEECAASFSEATVNSELSIKSLAHCTAETGKHTASLQESESLLRSCSEDISNLVQALDPWKSAETVSTAWDGLDSYTMQSERDIHSAVLMGEQTQQSTCFDDLGDNIELF